MMVNCVSLLTSLHLPHRLNLAVFLSHNNKACNRLLISQCCQQTAPEKSENHWDGVSWGGGGVAEVYYQAQRITDLISNTQHKVIDIHWLE